MTTLFITGATGFIGSQLLQKIPFAQYDHIYCLSRSSTQNPLTPNATFLQGGLFDAEVYRQALAETKTVVHLAAITGKATPAQYFAVNSTGTEFLLDQCRQAGVEQFLYVSTIAAKYPDKSNYYYAQSKERGETAVKNSGLSHTIVRPTIVICQQAAVWQSLSGLAKLPIMPVFGNGQATIQPIYIDDLIECLLFILAEPAFSNETLELGGAETVTFEQFLKGIHRTYFDKEPALTFHIPLGPLQGLLSALEKFLLPVLPVTAGQLSAFGNNGAIQENRVFHQHAVRMKTVQEMIRMAAAQS